MLRHTRFILLAIIAVPLLLWAAGKAAAPDKSCRLKAMSYYYDGVRLEMLDRDDAAYELYRRAYETDSSFAPAAVSYAFSRLNVNNPEIASQNGMEQTLAMIKKFTDAYPEDMPENDYAVYVLATVDSLNDAIRLLEKMDSIKPHRAETLLRLAQLYGVTGKYDKAIDVLDKYSLQDDNIQVMSQRVAYQLMTGDTLATTKYVNGLIDRHPKDYNYLLMAGNLYHAIDRNDTAMMLFRRAEQLDSTAALPKMAMAQLFQAMGDSTGYDNKIYEALLTKDMEIDDKLAIMAEYLQTAINNKADRARGDSLFSAFSRQYPHEPQVRDLSARYNAAKGNPSAAIEDICYALDQDITNVNYWSQLMAYQLQDEKYAEAMASFQKAKKHIEPTQQQRTLYATAAQLDGKSDVALAEYTDLIHEIAPSVNVNDTIEVNTLADLSFDQLYLLSQYLQSMGDIYYPLDSISKAFRCYDNSIAVMPLNSMALNNYAYFLSQQKEPDLDRALEMVKKSLQIEADNPTVIDTYAWILFKKGDYKEALTQQTKAIEKSEAVNETSAELYSHYGDILFMNALPEKAIEYWQKALSLINKETDKKLEPLLKKKIEHKTFFYE